MERFRSFERQKTPETPERRFLQIVRQEARDLLLRSSEGLVREIAEKILLKLEMKENIDGMQAGADDITWKQKFKKLGILIVREAKAEHVWEDASSGFLLEKGDSYLDLHLPPIAKDERDNLFSEATRSFKMLAEYVLEHNLNPKYILGVTYEKLAMAIKRYGFGLVEPPLPADIRAAVERVYKRFVEGEKELDPGFLDKKTEDMGRILVCYQTREDFLKRFINS